MESEKEWKKAIFLVFIGFSILVMLTLCENGYEGMSPVQEMINSLSLCGRHPLLRLPPGHLSPWISLKWQGICSSRSETALRCTLRRTRLIFWKTWIKFRYSPGLSPNKPGVLAHLGPEGQRWAQKASLATHAPPPPAARVRERRGSERGKPSHSSLIPL